ncbi:MAG: GNAT family N-acetyltransferase [Candidatus Zixiibacteriota bacterium]|nr:MAG: GNAT family N-acetyltransferase [candidate division Zixibacteria bacterium]
MTEKKKLFPTLPSLVGKKVYLRPATSDDVVNAHHWFMQSEPQMQCCEPLPFQTPSQAAELHRNSQGNDRQLLTIVLKDDKTPVGQVSFFDFNALNLSAALGIIIDPDQRRKGFAGEAAKLLIKYLFKYRNLNKVYAETADFNKEAIALLESVGFKKDGTLRQHYYYNGEYHDRLVYSLLRFEMDW